MSTSEFTRLKTAVAEAGLLKRAPLYYWIYLAAVLSAVFLLFTNLHRLTAPWEYVAAGVMLAFLNVQFGFLMHDAAHSAVFETPWKNHVYGVVSGTIFGGLSYRWWAPHHAEHHAHPNHPTDDPDIVDLEQVVAYTEQNAGSSRGWKRLVARHQHNLIFAMFFAQGFAMLFYSIRHLVRHRPRWWVAELGAIVAHYTCYGLALFYALDLPAALTVLVTHRMLVGPYVSMVVATNHMGMVRPDVTPQRDYLHNQIVTSRNVSSPAALDFLFAGLNYQIEHHLFPSMARPHLRRAQPIVRRFCAEHQIPYHETSLWRALVEMREYLRSVGTPARTGRAATA